MINVKSFRPAISNSESFLFCVIISFLLRESSTAKLFISLANMSLDTLVFDFVFEEM